MNDISASTYGSRVLPLLSLFLALALLTSTLPTQARSHSSVTDPNLRLIQKLLEQPEQHIDLARAKLTIDHQIGPSVDIAAGLRQLDSMARAIQSRLPPMATSRDKLNALRTYLYQAGPWNNNQPFSYDLDDPMGHILRNKLLSTYLATRKGNCVSMPLLFIILGQKLGLDVTAATAPEHIFVKYRDKTGTLYNIEATSGGGFARDVWLQQQMPMNPEALANGIYMQPLSKKETVVVIAGTLLEYYGQQGQEIRRIGLAKMVLKYYPKDISAMLHLSSAYYRLRQRNFVDKYPTPNDIPVQEQPYFAELDKNIGLWRGKAEALGWREAEQTLAYREIKTDRGSFQFAVPRSVR